MISYQLHINFDLDDRQHIADCVSPCTWMWRETPVYYFNGYTLVFATAVSYMAYQHLFLSCVSSRRQSREKTGKSFFLTQIDRLCAKMSLDVEGDTGLLFLWVYPCIRYGSFLYGLAAPIFIMCLFSETK